MDLKKYKHIHLIGIGGVGMRAIANILLAKGITVSGSDRQNDKILDEFKEKGATIYIGHDAKNIKGADLVVISSAIPKENPEICSAIENGIPIVHRADIVTAIMNDGLGIAVAGAHGKTTTTSMIGQVFEEAGNDSTIIIGGEVDYLRGNSKLGKGQFVLAEADESDGSFLKLKPFIGVITNIEDDHLDHYGTLELIRRAFADFLRNIDEKSGVAIICIDNENVRLIHNEIGCACRTYGFSEDADYRAKNVRYANGKMCFDVVRGMEELGTVSLQLPGKYNVLNALATVAVGIEVGIPFSIIVKGLARFAGAKRRFQTLGRYNDIWIVDDYAHHPTEIKATLSAAKEVNAKRVICVFQPHRYTRTSLLRDEFAEAFNDADIIVFTDIYTAGEPAIEGVTGMLLPDLVRQRAKDVRYVENKNDLPDYLKEIVRPGDLLIIMGAGDITACGYSFLEQLEKEA